MAGPLQKTGAHVPLKAIDSSNYAKPGADHGVPDGDVGKLGYVTEAYPTAGPALSNLDVRDSVSSYGSLGNDGTSRGAYEIQPDIVDADNPEPGLTGTGNTGARARG